MLVLISVSVLVVLATLYSWLTLVKGARELNVRGPAPLPFLGNGHMFMLQPPTEFISIMNRLAEKYNDVFSMHILSHRFVVVSDPKYLEAILSSSDTITKGLSYDFFLPWLGRGLLTSTGSKWKKHRKFLTPAFHFNILQTFLPVFTKNEKVLIDKLTNVADGRPVDLFPFVTLATLDMITESIMGVSFNAQKDSESEYVKAIEEQSEIVAFRMRNPFGKSDMFFNLLPHKTRQDKTLEIIHDESRKVIDTRRRELQMLNITELDHNSEYGIRNKHAFLDMLLLLEIDGEQIDDNSIREEVDTFMFAGHDTTTSGIAYILFCLAEHREIQDKVWKEQCEIFGPTFDRDVTFNDLTQMRYLEMVIKESLRLYPPAPMIERKMTQDINLLGINLTKDTSVLVNILRTHRNPNVFEDPLIFRPERFEKPMKNPFNWIPFSAGPRNCIGQRFAMMQMKVVVSAIVRKFNLSSSGMEPKLAGNLILKSTDGVYVKLSPRNAWSE